MDLVSVFSYLKRYYPDIEELVTKATNKFRYYTGFIKSEEDTNVLDTVILHDKSPAMVIGIKTLNRYPYFRFIWRVRSEEADAILSTQYESIFDTYNVVYDKLVYSFPCVLINSKAVPYKIIYDDKQNLFVVDLVSFHGLIIDKYVTWKRKVNPLDRNECITDTTTVKFDISGVQLTVKEYVLSYYLINFYKLLSIYRDSLSS
jgi:hypothetical protein